MRTSTRSIRLKGHGMKRERLKHQAFKDNVVLYAELRNTSRIRGNWKRLFRHVFGDDPPETPIQCFLEMLSSEAIQMIAFLPEDAVGTPVSITGIECGIEMVIDYLTRFNLGGRVVYGHYSVPRGHSPNYLQVDKGNVIYYPDPHQKQPKSKLRKGIQCWTMKVKGKVRKLEPEEYIQA